MMKEKTGSWFSLVMLCAVTALSSALMFSLLFAGASVAFAFVQSSPLTTSDASSSESAAESLSANPTSTDAALDNRESGNQFPDDIIANDSTSDNPVTSHAQAATVQAQESQDDGHAADNGEPTDRSFAGVITDSRCGARHSRNSGKTSAECARACVRNGSHYVLVDGEEVHALAGDANQLEKLAGERVHVMGMLEGDTIRVRSVAVR
ncbi:MAG TPA: hypothetical protein VHS34_16740 [Terriglobales bacterium]|jgi:hypothetical protein|nr:hypothetical protein [Terriglobales bacterium]